MKYATLKAERDDAIARAVEAERLSNKAVVDELETELQVTRMRLARAEHQRDLLKDFLSRTYAKLDVWLAEAPDLDQMLKEFDYERERSA